MLEGAKAYKFTRAFYGLFVSACIGFVVTWFTTPRSREEIAGLTYDTATHFANLKTESPNEIFQPALKTSATVQRVEDVLSLNKEGIYPVVVSTKLASELMLNSGDRILLSDHRWWFGGLRSLQVEVDTIEADDVSYVRLDAQTAHRIQASDNALIQIERLI